MIPFGAAHPYMAYKCSTVHQLCRAALQVFFHGGADPQHDDRQLLTPFGAL